MAELSIAVGSERSRQPFMFSLTGNGKGNKIAVYQKQHQTKVRQVY